MLTLILLLTLLSGLKYVCTIEANIYETALKILNNSIEASVSNETKFWPNAIIPYTVDVKFNQHFFSLVKKGMEKIENTSCIKFEKINESSQISDYVKIKNHFGCYSQTGRVGGVQVLGLGFACFTDNGHTVLHHLLKTVGLPYEHNRPDRDEYIQVYADKIIPSKKKSFRKRTEPSLTDKLNFEYDFFSIMHYSIFDFSINPSLEPSFLPNENFILNFTEIGTSEYLSDTDTLKVNAIYKCLNATFTSVLEFN